MDEKRKGSEMKSKWLQITDEDVVQPNASNTSSH